MNLFRWLGSFRQQSRRKEAFLVQPISWTKTTENGIVTYKWEDGPFHAVIRAGKVFHFAIYFGTVSLAFGADDNLEKCQEFCTRKIKQLKNE